MPAEWLRRNVFHPCEGGPLLRTNILGDAGLADRDAELEQFAVDARRAPKQIFDADPPDQYAQLGVNLRSAS